MEKNNQRSQDVLCRLKLSIQQKKLDYIDLFLKYDADYSGTISSSEFGLLLNSIDDTLTASDIFSLYD